MSNDNDLKRANAQDDGRDPLIDAAFLGPMAENAHLLETWVVQAVRDYAYWRRNVHPEDRAVMSAATELAPEFLEVRARTEDALRRTAARMKRSVPWFSPRHMGHMASDLLMPAIVARVLGTLYNPNNVSADAAGASIEMELDAGLELARMFGFEDAQGRAPWGHLTSGGSVANYEALRSLEALRLYPLAMIAGMRQVGLEPERCAVGEALGALSSWRLLNVAVDEVMPLRQLAMRDAYDAGGLDLVKRLKAAIEAERIETLGAVEFYRHHDVKQPVLLVPVSAHYSWEKGAKLIGLGTRQVIKIDVDERMRLDADALNARLDALLEAKTPVLAAVCVYGTTEFGTLDPVHEVVQARARMAALGLAFGVHVDAAWGGYLVSVFRELDGSLRDHDELRSGFHYFPSDEVYQATAALAQTDSITVDPHKLGFIPYPAGALVFRDRAWARLQIQSAPYVFDDRAADLIEPPLDFQALGKYVLEGSKPGASAVSVTVAHQVFPLHREGFGRIIAHTVRHAEEFHDRLRALSERLSGIARIVMPFEPDTNIVCIALNDAKNTDLSRANALTREVFDAMHYSPDEPTQLKAFLGSFTSLDQRRMTPEAAQHLELALGLEAGALHASEDAHVFLLRHTLMNPFLRRPATDGGLDYIDAYLNFLELELKRALGL